MLLYDRALIKPEANLFGSHSTCNILHKKGTFLWLNNWFRFSKGKFCVNTRVVFFSSKSECFSFLFLFLTEMRQSISDFFADAEQCARRAKKWEVFGTTHRYMSTYAAIPVKNIRRSYPRKNAPKQCVIWRFAASLTFECACKFSLQCMGTKINRTQKFCMDMQFFLLIAFHLRTFFVALCWIAEQKHLAWLNSVLGDWQKENIFALVNKTCIPT